MEISTGIFVVVCGLVLTPPLTGISIILLAEQYRPYKRTALAVGVMVLLMAVALALPGAAVALVRGQQPVWPYLIVPGIPAFLVWKMLHMQLQQDYPPSPFP